MASVLKRCSIPVYLGEKWKTVSCLTRDKDASSGAIWIAGIYISVLRALNVKIVVMNIYWHFHANAGIFVHHVTRKGWWNSANGYAQMC